MDFGGNIIVADNHNHRIGKSHHRAMCPLWQALVSGAIERDGEWNVVQFNWPRGVALDGGGNIIVADMLNHRIPKITPQDPLWQALARRVIKTQKGRLLGSTIPGESQ